MHSGDKAVHIDQIGSRARVLKDRPFRGGPVIYWMSRDQRSRDNWALLYAKRVADDNGVPLKVVFNLAPAFLGATYRQYAFMIKGLSELERSLKEMGIGFSLLRGDPEVTMPSFLHEHEAGALIADFDPLRIKRRWKRRVYVEDDLPFHEVDAHNIVPSWLVADRRISSYKVFRERITPLLDDYFDEFPPLVPPRNGWTKDEDDVHWREVLDDLAVDRSVGEVTWIAPGERAARASLDRFCSTKLATYPDLASNPLTSGQSDLSPYLHFGMLSPHRAGLEVRRSEASEEAKSKFLDQLIVKRELSDNFCLHTPDYDTVGAFPKWARSSIDQHRSDPRDHLYSLKEFEDARTHDPLWNAAQTELLKIGKIHGSLREYWAEKILEWSRSPEEALATANYLNNRYELDGNDPSGYTGIAMVIGGLYGRPWVSKEVLGRIKKLTYTEERMSYDTHAFQEMVKKL